LSTYADTSFLCALYRKQDNSERAMAENERLGEPLQVTRLLIWEFRQSARFQAFRFSNDRSVGYPLREAEKMISDLQEDIDKGLVVTMDCDLPAVLTHAERISRNRTPSGGHRSLDLLHVATAVELGVREFLSFDANQNRLAHAESLSTPLGG
jgi:predicted nucleic acid-binding protein